MHKIEFREIIQVSIPEDIIHITYKKGDEKLELKYYTK